MSERVAFLIGTGGGAYDALADALATHPEVQVGRDTHVFMSMAYLGYYDKVHKAPYDHILAAEAQRLFVEELPHKEADYIDACRAYGDSLYGPALTASGKQVFVDATPAYLDILPFLRRIFPEAPFVVVVRHPLELLAEGLTAAQVTRIVRATSALLVRGTRTFLIRTEALETDPGAALGAMCGFLGVAKSAPPLDFAQPPPDGAVDARDLAGLRRVVRRLTSEELAAYGYSLEELWGPLDKVGEHGVPRVGPSRVHTARLRALERLRRLAQRPGPLNRLLCKARLASDVLLRR